MTLADQPQAYGSAEQIAERLRNGADLSVRFLEAAAEALACLSGDCQRQGREPCRACALKMLDVEESLADQYMEVANQQARELQCSSEDCGSCRACLQRDVEAARRLIVSDSAFQAWAQGYLDSGKWAGHDRSDAIRQELLARDLELRVAHETIRRLTAEHAARWPAVP